MDKNYSKGLDIEGHVLLGVGDCSDAHIIIPDGVTHIGEMAFFYCESLEEIRCEAIAKPDGWSSSWNQDNKPVVWGYKE